MRSLLRDALVLVATGLTAPLWLLAWLEAAALTGDGVFKGCSELLSLVPGKPGIFLRRGFYRMCLEACALDCHIGFGTILAHPQVRIGRSVYIGHGCSLGKVIIEDDVAIGSNVDILSGRHQHGFSDPRRPIRDQDGVFQAIRIGRNVWIGNSAILMADIGDDCVIGAGSVVVRPIPARSVAAGNPATVKRGRDETPNRDQNPGPAAPRLTRVLTNGQRIS